MASLRGCHTGLAFVLAFALATALRINEDTQSVDGEQTAEQAPKGNWSLASLKNLSVAKTDLQEVVVGGKWYPVRVLGPGEKEGTYKVQMSFLPPKIQRWTDIPVEKCRVISPKQFANATQFFKHNPSEVERLPILMHRLIIDNNMTAEEKEVRRKEKEARKANALAADGALVTPLSEEDDLT